MHTLEEYIQRTDIIAQASRKNTEAPHLQTCIFSVSNLSNRRLSPYGSIPSKHSPGVKMRRRHLLLRFDTVLFSCRSFGLMMHQLPCLCSNRLPACPGPPGTITLYNFISNVLNNARPLSRDSSVCGSVFRKYRYSFLYLMFV
jgi:hypothetical protein